MDLALILAHPSTLQMWWGLVAAPVIIPFVVMPLTISKEIDIV